MKTLLLLACAAFSVAAARAQAPAEKPSLPAFPGPRPASLPPDSSGWRWTAQPRVEAIDDISGAIKFKIEVDEAGRIASLTVVKSTVSAKQAELCRQALQNVPLEAYGPKPKRTTGYYTFRFSVR